MLAGVADVGSQGSTPCSSRRDAYDCQRFVGETRDLPAKISPYSRRKSGANHISRQPGVEEGKGKFGPGSQFVKGALFLSVLVPLLKLEHAA